MPRTFEKMTEIIGWIRIALSPTLLGIVIGWGIFYNFPDNTGMIIGILIALIGLIAGILWATKKLKTTGTIHFLSKINK